MRNAGDLVNRLQLKDHEAVLIATMARALEARIPLLRGHWMAAIERDASLENVRAVVTGTELFGHEIMAGILKRFADGSLAEALGRCAEMIDNFATALLGSSDSGLQALEEMLRAADLLREIIEGESVGDSPLDPVDRQHLLVAGLRVWNALASQIAISCCSHFEREVREKLAAAEALARRRLDFLSGAAHEIRTPLNLVMGYADLMADRLEELHDSVAKQYADPMRRGAERLHQTVASLLNISAIESDRLALQPVAIDLAAFVERHVADYAPMATRKGLRISFDNRITPAQVMFDEQCLSNAIINLLQNAIKFTDTGEIRAEITRDADNRVCLTISDTGCGIDPQFLPRLFEPFARETKSGIPKEGSGLGLALVKRYVEMNRAKICVESRKHAGSRFTIVFEGIEVAPSGSGDRVER